MTVNHELRSGFKWTVNECLRLEREYDLLKLSVDEIALLHKRSPYAIICKLDYEGIADFNEIYQQTYPNDVSDEESAVDDDDSYHDQELEDDNQSEVSEEESSNDNIYDLKEQVRMLTKQLSNLTAIVYKSLIKSSSKDNDIFC